MNKDFNPLVTIVIPVYNGSNYIKEAIDSALNQTYKNIEIIVVNDGSTDNTDKIARSYGDKIRYFKKENGGVATALNLAIKEAKGDYISWLSHDDVYYKNKIEAQIEVLNKLEDKNTILYSDYTFINKKSRTKSYFCIESFNPLHKLKLPLYPILNGLIHGCTLLIPKKCFFEVDFFDEKLKTTQDYDLWFKMFPKYKIHYVQEFLVKSRTHNNQGSKIISSAKSEADELWINMISQITKHDILELEGSEYAFYQKVHNLMQGAKYEKAAQWVKNKLDNIKNNLVYKKDVKVSIIIPFYNRIELLKQAIKSVLNQTHSNFELLLINDFSNSDIREIKEIIKQDSRIYLYDNKFKKGASGARNTGISLAKGDYIAFLDSDDCFAPEKIEKQLNFMITNDYMVSNTYYQLNKSGKFIIPKYIKVNEIAYPKIISGCSIATPTVMINSVVFKEFGYKFNENYSYGEDVCLWIDIAKYFTIKTLQEPLTTVNRYGSNTIDCAHKLLKGCSNIFSHVVNEDTFEFYSDNLYDLLKFNMNIIQKNQTSKKKNIFYKFKLSRLIYRIVFRPFLKKKYGKQIVKTRFDRKYL